MTPIEFEPTDLIGCSDPYALLAEVRNHAPVARLRSGMWAVTGYAAAMEVFHQPACASGPIALRYLEGLPPGAARDEMSHRINFLDPPDHTRVRGLLSKAFTPRRVAALVPWMRETAAQLLAALDDGGKVDLLRAYAHQLPSLVISQLLGVPIEDRDRLTRWSDEVAPLLGFRLSDAEREAAVRASESFHTYLGRLLDTRRRQPSDDLLTALLAAEENGERLTRVELLSLAATLYSAGHRTTRDLFSNGMAVLLRDGGERFRRVVEGTWSVPDVVAEFLRYETPTLFVARVPLEAVRVGGIEVGAYEPLLIFLAAANRDPAVFAAPDTFHPGRSEAAPLSFAYGAHYCLGASLARAEAEVMLDAVRLHWPDLALEESVSLRWHQRGPFRGLDELPVRRRAAA
jgi:cytochrome P450